MTPYAVCLSAKNLSRVVCSCLVLSVERGKIKVPHFYTPVRVFVERVLFSELSVTARNFADLHVGSLRSSEKRTPFRKRKSEMNRTEIANKVLVYAVNEGLRRGAFTLTPGPVVCPKEGFSFDIHGIPALVHFDDIGFDEVTVKATLWPTNKGREWAQVSLQKEYRSRAGGFYVLGWFERRKGRWIMELAQTYCAKERREEVEALPMPQPAGYEAKGRFIF